MLHKFELVPPSIINLEELRIKNPTASEKKKYIEGQIKDMKTDILKNDFSLRDLANKYKIAESTIKHYLSQQVDYQELKEKLNSIAKKKKIIKNNIYKDNPLLSYKLKYNLTSKEISQITNIPLPTIRAIEIGKTKIENIKESTRQKLNTLNKLEK